MGRSKVGVFSNHSVDLYNFRKGTAIDFYIDVYRQLEHFRDMEVTIPTWQWILKALYAPFPPNPGNREKRMQKDMNVLDAVIGCQPNRWCRRTSYCLDCLGNWRYKNAVIIQNMHERFRDLRLLLRRETILVPRGVYYTDRKEKKLGLLIDEHINPVYDLPTGSKWHQKEITRVVEDYRLQDFRKDEYETTDQYSDILPSVWGYIGGMDVMVSPWRIDAYNKGDEDFKAMYESSAKRDHDTLHYNLLHGVSDIEHNPLMLELLVHATNITNVLRKSPGYLHRLIVVPSYLNCSTVVLRLDSLILDTWDKYRELREVDGYWTPQKHFRDVSWRGHDRNTLSYRSKVNTTCVGIPDNIHSLLRIMEERFPFTGGWFAKFLPEEFLFYMNCLSNYRTVRSGGVFNLSA